MPFAVPLKWSSCMAPEEGTAPALPVLSVPVTLDVAAELEPKAGALVVLPMFELLQPLL